MMSSIKPEVSNIALSSEEDRATATGNKYRKFHEVRTCRFRDASGQTDRQTDPTQTRSSQYLALNVQQKRAVFLGQRVATYSTAVAVSK